MGRFFNIDKLITSFRVQIIVIGFSFLIMGLISFFYASAMERKNLKKEADIILDLTISEITNILAEPEMFLYGYSDTIRNLILQGSSIEQVTAYIRDIVNLSFRSRDRSMIMGSHNYFYINDGIYISGRSWIPPDGYNPEETPWYYASVEAEGMIAISDPFRDSITGNSIITLSRYLYDDYGEPLGVVCINFDFTNAYKLATSNNFSRNSYGFLLNNDLKIIAHPAPYLLGEKFDYTESGLSVISNELEQGVNIDEHSFLSYSHEKSIVFFRSMKHGWRVALVIPSNEYFRSIYLLSIFLFCISGLMTAILSFIFHNISKAKIKSDHKSQQKSNFLATISHEIRTPLNAILGMTEMQMQNAAHPPLTSEVFIKINNSGNLLLNIINDILDLSKIETGKLEINPIRYEVASMVNDVVQLNYILYEGKPIDFKIEVAEDTPAILVGDELRIKQILNNLISNSFKYTDKGSITLAVSAECVGRGGIVQVTLIFKIIDTGQGMTQEQINNLFDEYTRFNLESNRTSEGAGLGMTITNNLINMMNGKINVKSVVGEGTTIIISIPQKTDGIGISSLIGKEMAENLQDFKMSNFLQLKKSQIEHEYMPYGNILIVDDVETNLYVAKGLMSPYGLKIELAISGYEAIEKIKENNVYDIIFMDHMMPKLDGIETTKQLREMGYTQPIVALTANAVQGQAEVFLNNGFDDFISKPINVRQLNALLNKLIRDKQSFEVLEAARKQREEVEIDKKQKPETQEDFQIDSQLAEIFSKDGDKSIAVLETVMQNNFKTESDLQLYVINIHAMKSALANIGKIELSNTAQSLEQAGREKNMDFILSETPNFINELRTIVEELKPKDSNVIIEDSKESLALLQERLEIISEACSLFDKKTAKDNLNELREKMWSNKIKDMLNSISEHLLHSEFDDAAALIDSYLNNNK